MKRLQKNPALIFIAAGILIVVLSCMHLYKKQSAPIAAKKYEITVLKNKTIAVYNPSTEKLSQMDLETYILGVLSAEMPALYETEALKAQAVCARTYTLYKIEHGGCGRYPGAEICTDFKHCQAYNDETALRALWQTDYDLYLQKLKSAVDDTRAEVITYAGQPIQALYHSISGGQTEDAQNVFSQALPYLVGVSSPGEEYDTRFSAQKAFTFAEVAQRINALFGNGTIKTENVKNQAKINSTYPSGRVQTCMFGKATFSGTQARTIFELNSAHFSIRVEGENLVFTTVGNGHGVGMSQTGANAMAKQQSTYLQILRHYYTGVTIEKLY